MSIKKYGIFIAYPSKTGLFKEEEKGLIQFLQALAEEPLIQPVIACPNWSIKPLRSLLARHRINASNFEFISPKERPIVLLASKASQYLLAKTFAVITRTRIFCQKILTRLFAYTVDQMLACRNLFYFFLSSLLFLICFPFCLLFTVVILLDYAISYLRKKNPVRLTSFIEKMRQTHINEFYNVLISNESSRIANIINKRQDIPVWFIPSAAWIDINQLQIKSILLALDDVNNYSPVQYGVNPNYSVDACDYTYNSIVNSHYFITNNNKIKKMLIDKYQKAENHIAVIRPAIVDLAKTITVSGFADNELASKTLCKNLIKIAMSKNIDADFNLVHSGNQLNFLFCTGQLSTSSNLLNLLKAYKSLLDTEAVTSKLLINYDKKTNLAALDFIRANLLQQHVFWLENLTEQELAACYKIALFVVDASFEFNDAETAFRQSLSISTPILLPNNMETRALFAGEQLLVSALFNAFNWQDIATKLKWALTNREQIKERQEDVFAKKESRSLQQLQKEYLTLANKFSSLATTEDVNGKEEQSPSLSQPLIAN